MIDIINVTSILHFIGDISTDESFIMIAMFAVENYGGRKKDSSLLADHENIKEMIEIQY